MSYCRISKIFSIFKHFYGVILALAIAVGGSWLAREKTHHFTISRILSPLNFRSNWVFDNPPIIEEILSQPYHFFSYGGQSWVFLSQDGQWVIKFLDFRPTWHDAAKTVHLPSCLCPKLTERQLRRRESAASGYALAAERFRENCGLVGIFLNGKKEGSHLLTLTDPIFCPHVVDLRNCSFVVQKKAEPFPQRMTAVMMANDIQGVKNTLSSALNLIAERTAQGLGDNDNIHLHCNLGFAEDRAIYLDAGAFYDNPSFLVPQNAEAEILRAADLIIEQLSK